MKKISLLLLLFAFVATTTFAQEEKAADPKWKKGLGIGLDFAQLLQINPKVGAGQNRLGLGGAITYFANMKDGKHAWDNSVSWKIGVQRLGSGLLANGTGTQKIPLQKQIDELRLDSKYGYAITADKKWFVATELSFLSQILKTYSNSGLTDAFAPGTHEISKFMSPGVISYSVGIDYKPNDNLSIYYSPIGLKAIIVADDDIASKPAVDKNNKPIGGVSLHGTPWRSKTDFDNTLFNLGSLLKIQYQNKFFPVGKEHRVHFKTYATFFYDYLQGQKKKDNPNYKTNVDVDWGTETSFLIFKGLSAVLTTNLYYDWDVPVQETDYTKTNGVSGNLVRKPSFTQQLLIKYTVNF